jgi:hypothetical protein
MIRMIDNRLISETKLQLRFKDIMGVLKNCIDDDWANDLRFTSVVLIRFIRLRPGSSLRPAEYLTATTRFITVSECVMPLTPC